MPSALFELPIFLKVKKIILLYKKLLTIAVKNYKTVSEIKNPGANVALGDTPSDIGRTKAFQGEKKMKKIIAAAAGLMLTGAMISSAVASVEIAGNARTRYQYFSDYDFGLHNAATEDYSADRFYNRVRLNVTGTTASGATAYVQFNAGDATWGNGGMTGINVDYAYMDVPVGCAAARLGRQEIVLTPGFHAGTDLDAAKVSWTNEATTLVGFYAIINSDYDVAEQFAVDQVEQHEDRVWGAALIQGFGDWSMTAATTYVQLDLTTTDDGPVQDLTLPDSGFNAALMVAGPLGPVAFAGELGYQEDGIVPTDEFAVERTGDNGFGGYFSAGMDVSEGANVTFVAGGTVDGFVFDIPVGFLMIGGDSVITPSFTKAVGQFDSLAMDTWFAGFKTSYVASEALTLGLNLAYADMESADGSAANLDANAWELSASANYAVSDGVALIGQVGYLGLDIDDVDTEDAIGAGVSLELKF